MASGEWDAILATMSVQDQAAVRRAVGPLAAGGWQPTPLDIASLSLVAEGALTGDAFIRLHLTEQPDGDAAETAETADSPVVSEAAATVASAAAATRARWLLGQARDARVVLERIRRVPAAGVNSRWLKHTARQTMKLAGPKGDSGALGQFHGHFFEQIDVRAYNLRNRPMRRVLQLRGRAHAPGYDASRFIRGRFAGGIQHKLSANSVGPAARKLNARKPGSATRATLRVPKDQARRATTRVAGRMRVEASDVSRAAVKRRGNAGLKQLSRKGNWAVSPAHQFGRKAGASALTGMAVGAAADARRLYRKEMNGREFVSRRGVDAAEQGASYAAGAAATAGVVAGLNAVAAGGSVLAGAAAVAAGSGVWVPLAVSTAAGGVVVHSMKPIRRRAEAWAETRSRRRHHVATDVSDNDGGAPQDSAPS